MSCTNSLECVARYSWLSRTASIKTWTAMTRSPSDLWMTEADKIVALARICPAGTHMKEISIGRVITTERGKGYGQQIMLYAIDAAVEHFGATLIDIEAQEYAKGFYESVGFKQSSDTFMLDGIPHIKMTWTKDDD